MSWFGATRVKSWPAVYNLRHRCDIKYVCKRVVHAYKMSLHCCVEKLV